MLEFEIVKLEDNKEYVILATIEYNKTKYILLLNIFLIFKFFFHYFLYFSSFKKKFINLTEINFL